MTGPWTGGSFARKEVRLLHYLLANETWHVNVKSIDTDIFKF